jgi:hypothetical protein
VHEPKGRDRGKEEVEEDGEAIAVFHILKQHETVSSPTREARKKELWLHEKRNADVKIF